MGHPSIFWTPIHLLPPLNIPLQNYPSILQKILKNNEFISLVGPFFIVVVGIFGVIFLKCSIHSIFPLDNCWVKFASGWANSSIPSALDGIALKHKFNLIHILTFIFVPIMHVFPPHPGGQAQKNKVVERVVRHVPPFLHGFSSQGSIN